MVLGRGSGVDVARVLDGELVAVALRDGEVVVAPVLPVVGAVALVPGSGVHRAVGPLRHVVLAQHVGVEEVARVVGAVAPRVVVVVLGCRLARRGTLARVVDAGVVLGANVRVGGLDSAAKGKGAVKVGYRVRGGVLVVPFSTHHQSAFFPDYS